MERWGCQTAMRETRFALWPCWDERKESAARSGSERVTRLRLLMV